MRENHRSTQPPKKAPLLARPVYGPIDHKALSLEFMARFPKLRAALAG